MNIFELTGNYLLLQEALENGEDVEEMLEQISDDIEVKAEAYARIIKNFDSDMEGLKASIEEQKAKLDRLEKAKERMKGNLFDCMVSTGKRKFKSGIFSFNIAKNGGKDPIILNDEIWLEDLPDELKTVKTTVTVNKEAIREYIMETGDLTYGSIGERGEHLTIR